MKNQNKIRTLVSRHKQQTIKYRLPQQRQAFAADSSVTIMSEAGIKKVILLGYKILNKLNIKALFHRLILRQNHGFIRVYVYKKLKEM